MTKNQSNYAILTNLKSYVTRRRSGKLQTPSIKKTRFVFFFVRFGVGLPGRNYVFMSFVILFLSFVVFWPLNFIFSF